MSKGPGFENSQRNFANYNAGDQSGEPVARTEAFVWNFSTDTVQEVIFVNYGIKGSRV
jgi:hypothetical protein